MSDSNIPPAPVPPNGDSGPILVTIGDIAVSDSEIITPAGTIRTKGAVWTVTDFSRTTSKIPTHAIVLAIIFALFCLIGLLFLLMKEEETTGHVQVTVHGDGKTYQTSLPVNHAGAAYQINQQVQYARNLSAM
ncbi:hypothetical protein [Salininema proteolyticum]|uniref:RsgI N-terminal anti-sigma domain-containing protein n=1 Tax=Salininema proteolyticum TaxID=1607685 RepID=A0ABV8TWF7_9ACTN